MSYVPPIGDTGAVAPVTLRDYQQAAVDAIREAFGEYQRLVFVLPTGGGKTVTFAYVTKQAQRRGKRIVIVAHRIEIIRQISLALTRQGVEHGVIAPGYAMLGGRVQVAMIQTLANRLGSVPEPDLLIEDECHHAVSGTYQKVRARWGRAKVLGVTATPERLDGRGLGFAFDHMVIGPTPRTLIDRGSLSDFTYLAPPTDDLDLSDVHTRGGDYAADELAAAVEKSTIYGNAVKHYARYLGGKPAIAFCISVRHAEIVAERFNRAGWRAASIDGAMGKLERQAILADLEAGRLDVLTSCDLISEGFDVPTVQGAILLRPTKSLAVYLQQVGRSLRPKPDGSKAIILDHVNNWDRHGLPDWERSWTLDGKRKRAPADPVTVCTLCFKAMPADVPKAEDFTCPGVTDNETGMTLPCPYLVEKPVKPRAPFTEEVDGELVDVTAKAPPPPDPMRPDWAKGFHLRDVRGLYWHRLLDLAGTDLDRLKEIAKARGYKRGWAQHRLQERHRLDMEVQSILDGHGYWSETTEDALWAITRMEDAPAGLKAVCREEINKRKTRAA